ncbi:MAG: hypothetical protein C3F02_02415 [Parcubacteria group bacterium]|nr:MAG: hypothetical protein C3F02_02415 [Parcubacteria group bacterium]
MPYGLVNSGDAISPRRLNALQGVIFFLMIVIVGRLFYLQIIRHEDLLQAGLAQRAVVEELSPERGSIYALAGDNSVDFYPLAVNNVNYDINADPAKISRPQNITDIFASVLGLDDTAKAEIFAKLKKTDRHFETIAKQIPKEKEEQLRQALEQLRTDINQSDPGAKPITSLAEMGVNFNKTVLRYYPDKQDGAQVLGFFGYGQDGYSRVGSYGLEGFFEQELSGAKGSLTGEKDVKGRLINQENVSPRQNGANLVLTIDRNVQYAACQALAKALPLYQADSGTIIVMESSSGAIRAMCNYPSFDPNEYNKVDSPDVYNNNAVYAAYEPGSVMKVIAMAIAIDQGKVTPNTTFDDKGEVKFKGGEIIKNADLKAHGVVDMKEVLASSLNTGIVFATADISNTIFKDYMEKFGFGKATGITISQESAGDISALAKKGDIFKATASFGQGITVTPLQMIAAVNVIANRGSLLRPYIVSQINWPDGQVQKFQPEVVQQVIQASTAAQLAAMMVNNVDNGHAQAAKIDGYYLAGKTGTADVPNPQTKRYDSGKTIHSFIGFVPHENAKFIMLTKLDNPQTGRFAESTAVPLFADIAKYLLEYYQIAPSR